ncbi:MAG: hypothetical protein PWR19_1968 [Carnobacterium sp.]|uniref:O-antigen polymerase n=1 Tax=Carnobacterium sp. TaxID=48221 RepID=UPI0026481153|nr:O-antigen polymerase [Carnobacterium sp.]MDN5372922.1 hypothetical protein [Carnobacterium sp.]
MEFTRKKILIIALYFLVGLFFMYKYNYVINISSIHNLSSVNYINLVFSYFLVVGIFVFLCIKKNCDIFEPFIFCSIIMILIFIVTPLINMILNDTYSFGVYVMGASLKATWIFNLSYISFCLGYFSIKIRDKMETTLITSSLYLYRKKIVKTSVVLWILSFTLVVVYLITKGFNLSYILTLGTGGNLLDQSNGSGTLLGFLSMFGYMCVTLWLLIVVFSKSLVLKGLTGILTLLILIFQGFRFIIVIMILAPIIYYYIKIGKRPTPLTWFFLGLMLTAMIIIIGFTRNNISSGLTISWGDINLDFAIEVIKGNFDIYKSYYGVINAVPNEMGFTYGKQFLYTFIMLIPRFIWPNKPEPLQAELVELGLNKTASLSGFAFPNLGEYYSEFGIIGSILILFILGKIIAKCKLLYQGSNRNENTVIIYSVILPACMQLIIRGYTPSNFYLIFFLIAPVWIVNKTIRMKIK